MSTKKAVITGSAGGLGNHLVNMLAKEGWDLLLVNRDSEHARDQLEQLQQDYPNQLIELYPTNLMDLEEIKSTTAKIQSEHEQLGMLLNVAGVLTEQRKMSVQNLESNFAVNTAAPYAMAMLLQPLLAKGASAQSPSVVVNFSSGAINAVKQIDIQSLANPEKIGGLMGSYAKSKFALDLLTCALAEDFAALGIYVISVDPGPTKTKMTDGNTAMPWIIRVIRPLLFKPADKQAKKVLDSIEKTREQGAGGLYFAEGKQKPMPKLLLNRSLQEELKQQLDKVLF